MKKSKKASLVSFVVVNWNTLEDTKLAIESIEKQDYPNFEIVIVDNGSEDGSKEYFSTLKNIIFVDLEANTGFTGGHIAGLKYTRGEFIALINSDAVLGSDWASVLINSMKDKSVAAAGGRAYNWTYEEEEFDKNNSFYSYQIINNKMGYARTLQTGEEKCEVDSISGAAVMIRKSVIDDYGYLDNDFFAYYEETDLFARYKRAGYKIIYEPFASIWHKIGASTRNTSVDMSYSYFYLYQMQRNRFMFAIKNFDAKQARYFFYRYLISGVKARLKYSKNKNSEYKAQYKALYWNIMHLATTLKKRSKISKIGASYTDKLTHKTLPEDITIVIPCYNYADFVVDALDSIKKQTRKPKRVIVINDGSTDNSLSVLKKYQEKNKDVEVYSQSNSGVVATKNRGLAMVKTTWTIFFDADDIMKPTYIESVMRKAQEKLADVTYTDMEYFGHIKGIHKSRKFNLNALLKENFIHNSALISTDRLREINGYKNEMSGGYEDWELYISLAEAGSSFAHVPEDIFMYRQRTVSRNIEAKEIAEKLHELVRSLHLETYGKYNHGLFRVTDIFKRVCRNPEIIFIASCLLPISLLGGLRGFVSGYKKSFSFRLRKYLHDKDVNNE